jgi:hypothetical protein
LFSGDVLVAITKFARDSLTGERLIKLIKK